MTHPTTPRSLLQDLAPGPANKAWAAAAVVVLSWLLTFVGVDVPAEVQGALAVLLVWLVPNTTS